VGAALLKYLTPSNMQGNLGLLQPGKFVSVEQALIVEMIITFFLVFVIFSLIDRGRKDVGGSVPFIVGLSVCVNIFYSVSPCVLFSTTDLLVGKYGTRYF